MGLIWLTTWLTTWLTICKNNVICKLFFVYLYRYAILDLLRNLKDIIYKSV